MQRNALRHPCLFHPYWVLARPAKSWFEIHFNCRIIPENFFYRQLRMKWNTFDRLLAILRPFLQREDTKLRNYHTRESSCNRKVSLSTWRIIWKCQCCYECWKIDSNWSNHLHHTWAVGTKKWLYHVSHHSGRNVSICCNTYATFQPSKYSWRNWWHPHQNQSTKG